MLCYTLKSNEEIVAGIRMYHAGDWWQSQDCEVRTCRHDPPQIRESVVEAASVVRIRVDDTVYHVLRKPDGADTRILIQDEHTPAVFSSKEIEVLRGGYTRVSRYLFWVSRGTVLNVGLTYLVIREDGVMFTCNEKDCEFYLSSLKTASEVTTL